MSKNDKHQQDPQFKTTDLTGLDLLGNRFLNKDLAFSEAERSLFSLNGLLAPRIETLADQIVRLYQILQMQTSDLAKYYYLRRIQKHNVVLFYALVQQYQQELLPIIYTPTIGQACQKFSEYYVSHQGVYISYPQMNEMEKIFSHPMFDRIKLIVVSDGERVLSLGDQGAGGMGIAIGKATLYTACAGVPPEQVLPVQLDTGTNNIDRLNHPLYIGWRHERIRGQAYLDFIEQFVATIKKRFPWVLLHWEDFSDDNAKQILKTYRHDLCTINGDIEGTPAIALGTLMSAAKAIHTTLKDHRFAIVSNNTIGKAISEWIVKALKLSGISEQEARDSVYLIDASQQKILDKIISKIKATMLIGICGKPNLFNEAVIKAIYANTKQPIVLALSTPHDYSEANPADVLRWTNYQAIICTASPYAPVEHDGQSYPITQANNIYFFPGFGLGLLLAQPTIVTDELYLSAVEALATESQKYYHSHQLLLPPMQQIKSLSAHIAYAVAFKASELDPGLNSNHSNLQEKLNHFIWQPIYLPLKKR